jgi:hypothetical protein
MHSSSWITLLRTIPSQQYDNLVVTTSSGVELMMQALIRTEEEYLVLRGRLSGSTDAGRIFFVPYDQINFINFINPVKEAEINAFYERGPQAADVQATDEADHTAAVEERPAQPAAPAAGAPQQPARLRTPLAGRSAILDRLRARVAPKQPEK